MCAKRGAAAALARLWLAAGVLQMHHLPVPGAGISPCVPCRYEEAIIEDMKRLHITPHAVSHTSDWFEQIQTYLAQLFDVPRSIVS